MMLSVAYGKLDFFYLKMAQVTLFRFLFLFAILILESSCRTLESFSELCRRSGTDKCNVHNYQTAYYRYLMPLVYKARENRKTVRILEIGLGLGGSVRFWTSLFADVNLELHILEKDVRNIWNFTMGKESEIFNASLPKNVKYWIHSGSQADIDELSNVVKNIADISGISWQNLKAGGHLFDVVIDDGGHLMNEQLVSLVVLTDFLVPSGIYFLEDLFSSFDLGYNQNNQNITTVEEISKLLRHINGATKIVSKFNSSIKFDLYSLTAKVASIDVYKELCVFVFHSELYLTVPFQEAIFHTENNSSSFMLRYRGDSPYSDVYNSEVNRLKNSFYHKACSSLGSMHCTLLNQEIAYAKYLNPVVVRRNANILLLGIGGCGDDDISALGKYIEMWRIFVPGATFSIVEENVRCLVKYRSKPLNGFEMHPDRFRVHLKANEELYSNFLLRLAMEWNISGTKFDYIIDNNVLLTGVNTQILTITYLFEFLISGGAYFMHDLYIPSSMYRRSSAEFIVEMVESMQFGGQFGKNTNESLNWLIPAIEHIDCFAGLAVIQK